MSTSHFGIKEHVINSSYIREYPGALLDDQEDTLQLHVKQYTPSDGSHLLPGAVTVIGAHANAFPKELYEALWDDLFTTMKGRDQAIAGIWIADVAHQGMSGVMNEDKLGNDPSWYDHPRDMFLMINHFRKEMPRPLIGIGHSMGGNHVVNLSYNHPRLLSCVVLIDPVIHDPGIGEDKVSSSEAQKSAFRRDLWNSKAEAKASFLRSPFYQKWDSRVLDLMVHHGLRKLPTALYAEYVGHIDDQRSSITENGPVTLTTTKHQEVFTFLRPTFEGVSFQGKKAPNRYSYPDLDPDSSEKGLFYRPEPARTFQNLQYLRPSALYIFGGRSPLSRSNWRQAKMSRTGTGIGGSGGIQEDKVRERVFESVGHLLPMEIPLEVAEASANFIERELKQWREDEQAWKKAWKAKSKAEKTILSETWKRNIGGDLRPKSSHKL